MQAQWPGLLRQARMPTPLRHQRPRLGFHRLFPATPAATSTTGTARPGKVPVVERGIDHEQPRHCADARIPFQRLPSLFFFDVRDCRFPCTVSRFCV